MRSFFFLLLRCLATSHLGVFIAGLLKAFAFFEKSLLVQTSGENGDSGDHGFGFGDSANYLFIAPDEKKRMAELREKYCKCFAEMTKRADDSKIVATLNTFFGYVDHFSAEKFSLGVRFLMDITEFYFENSPDELESPEILLSRKWISVVEASITAEEKGELKAELKKEIEDFVQAMSNRSVRLQVFFFYFFGWSFNF